MKLEKKELFLIGLIVLMFIVSFAAYPKMPERMPTHWDAEGNVDGYGSRFTGLFLMPIFLSGIYLLFLFLPKIMVYQKNFERFKDHFYGFKLVFVLFFIAIYTAMLLPNFGIKVNMAYIMIPSLAALFFYIGHMLKFAKRNYFIGIRTPWTLADEEVWDKTHKLGSKLFTYLSLIILSAMFFPKKFAWIVLSPIILIILILFIYSLVEYKKRVKKR
ncbi:DUF1648 domain-containing protein [Candidatus Woesearchaeota archaeon]|nr:DUF1648 domain-containing protein [Candidatus Woesearchaeota archaeon]